MYHACAACKRTEKTDHEIDRMICRKNTEIAHARPKRVERSESDALLKIILVRHHAAFGAATGSGGIDDACNVFSLARNENWFRYAAKFFPSLSAGKIGVCWGFGD